MQFSRKDRRDTASFSSFVSSWLYETDRFAYLKAHALSTAHFEHAFDQRKTFNAHNRQVLTEVLSEQYKDLNLSEAQKVNLEALKTDQAFTVCTGHQLSLFTGPAFFIYKILHIIRLAEELEKAYPGKKIAPVFWMATEDHDFEEIQSLNLFRKQIKWDSEQTGATGRMELKNWSVWKNELKALFANHPEAEVHALLESYNGQDLAEATLKLVHHLFAPYGLLILNADHPKLKTLFAPTMQKEITSPFAEQAVSTGNQKLKEAGFEAQAMARPINLFYLSEQQRTRIIPEEGRYRIGEKLLDLEELNDELQHFPERFSPNVILRPVYQETILPNLCYVGGGGEIAYWAQLPEVFKAADVPFPLLQIRNSVQFMEANVLDKAAKLGFASDDLFASIDALKAQYLTRVHVDPLDLSAMEQAGTHLREVISALILSVDPAMKAFAEAEQTRLNNQLENITQKIRKAEKSKYDQSLKQIENLHARLFPNNGLQERHDHFLNYCPDGNYRQWLNELLPLIDPFNPDLLLIH